MSHLFVQLHVHLHQGGVRWLGFWALEGEEGNGLKWLREGRKLKGVAGNARGSGREATGRNGVTTAARWHSGSVTVMFGTPHAESRMRSSAWWGQYVFHRLATPSIKKDYSFPGDQFMPQSVKSPAPSLCLIFGELLPISCARAPTLASSFRRSRLRPIHTHVRAQWPHAPIRLISFFPNFDGLKREAV
jgi:hypothetical protein